MTSPLSKFGCGCIGVPLNRTTEGRPDCADVWLFTACDREDDLVSGSIRPLEHQKVEAAVPLTQEDFEKLRFKMEQQLSAGGAMFDLHRALRWGDNALRRFGGGDEIRVGEVSYEDFDRTNE